jgi:nitrite reductase/ring-hydroxylating ferredoxin subunit
MMDPKVILLFGFCVGVGAINWFNNWTVLYATILLYAIYSLYEKRIEAWIQKNFLLSKIPAVPSRVEHDKRRNMSYPDPVANTWYCLCDGEDLPPGKVMEIRALGQTLVLWRTNDGTPVCQDAYCIHIGANIAVGGWVENNCITCPFHHWKFDENGNVKEIPYKDEPHNCTSIKQKLRTYECVDWCGLVFVWFHADNQPPEFPLPSFIPEELQRDHWQPHLKWDMGFFPLTPADWCDQSSDWAHFNTLHAEFLIPWTMIAIPKWLKYFLPMGIHHTLKTYLGDEKEWQEIVRETGVGEVNKRYIFFTDLAGITWKGKPVSSSMSQTLETFVGPALMVFNIPFTIGKREIKVIIILFFLGRKLIFVL